MLYGNQQPQLVESIIALKSDAELQREVLKKLRWDSSVHALEVGVAVQQGVVAPTGSVEHARGVQDVEDRLVIQPYS